MNFCRWFIYVIFLKRKIKKIKKPENKNPVKG